MADSYVAALHGPFAQLARLVRDDRTDDALYQAIAEWAVRLVPGCDHASVSILRGGQFLTLGASDAMAVTIDDLERAVDDGPCLDAIREDSVQHDPDLSRNPTWPRLAERVLAETPVRSVLAFRLAEGGLKGGALNLFADQPNALDAASIEQGAILAAFASIAFIVAQEREKSAGLAVAVDSNREIGKAVGLLMAAHGVSSEQAFQMLSQASQNLNRKLRDLAQEIVAHGEPGS